MSAIKYAVNYTSAMTGAVFAMVGLLVMVPAWWIYNGARPREHWVPFTVFIFLLIQKRLLALVAASK